MRESRTYGSVRGAFSNERPYRVLALCCDCSQPLLALSACFGMSASASVAEREAEMLQTGLIRRS
jgi:hypothetical protein